MRKVFFCTVAALTTVVVGAAAPSASFGAALPRDKILLTYGGKPVTCRDLVLLTWPQIQGRLRAIARYVKRPPGGDWPRVEAMLFPVRGPILFHQPPRGASVQQALRGMCRSYLQSAVDSYLAKQVVLEFAARHHFHYQKHFHVKRLHEYNRAWARAWDADSQLFSQFAEHRWTAVQIAAAARRAMPGASPSLVASWQKLGTAYFRRTQKAFPCLLGALFPGERNGVVAPWIKITVPDICFQIPMFAAIQKRRARFAKLAAQLYGTSGFVVVENLLPNDEAAGLQIIRACTGPGGRINKPRVALIQSCLWLEGSPTRIDPGFGGNYSYFSDLTGLPVRKITPETFIRMKGKQRSLIFIYQRHPTVAKFVVAMTPSSYLWQIGESALLKSPARAVLAKTRAMVPWIRLPGFARLVGWSRAYGVLPTTHCFGFRLPQLVRKKYRREKW